MRFLFVSLISSFFIFSSCKSIPNLTEEEVYTLLNEITKDDNNGMPVVCWKFDSLQLTDEYKKEFTSEDLSFINKQNKLFSNLKIKPKKLKWYHENDSSTYNYTEIDTTCDAGIVYHISFPLISADREKVLLRINENCNCMLGGEIGTYLYEKKNGHWILIKIFNHSISLNIGNKKIKNLFV